MAHDDQLDRELQHAQQRRQPQSARVQQCEQRVDAGSGDGPQHPVQRALHRRAPARRDADHSDRRADDPVGARRVEEETHDHAEHAHEHDAQHQHPGIRIPRRAGEEVAQWPWLTGADPRQQQRRRGDQVRERASRADRGDVSEGRDRSRAHHRGRQAEDEHEEERTRRAQPVSEGERRAHDRHEHQTDADRQRIMCCSDAERRADDEATAHERQHPCPFDDRQRSREQHRECSGRGDVSEHRLSEQRHHGDRHHETDGRLQSELPAWAARGTEGEQAHRSILPGRPRAQLPLRPVGCA